MPELMAGQPKMSHTNDVSCSLPSQEILKLLAWSPSNIVYVCDYEVWVHLYHIMLVLLSWVTLNMILSHPLTKLEFWSEIQ